jgi:replication-associated recombination protein RarA
MEHSASVTHPVALSEKYRPVQICRFLGLREARRILAGFAAKPFSSAWLFHGPTGVGKTSMGMALANEIAAQLHHIPARLCTLEMVEKVCRDCHYAPCRADWSPACFHLCLVDECDAMTKPAQLSFLSKLDATACPPQTIFVFTSNSIETLEGRFISRCRTLEFMSQGIASELPTLLAHIWAEEALGQSPPDFEEIGNAAQGDVRTAINSLEILIVSERGMPGRLPSPAQKATPTKNSGALTSTRSTSCRRMRLSDLAKFPARGWRSQSPDLTERVSRAQSSDVKEGP